MGRGGGAGFVGVNGENFFVKEDESLTNITSIYARKTSLNGLGMRTDHAANVTYYQGVRV